MRGNTFRQTVPVANNAMSAAEQQRYSAFELYAMAAQQHFFLQQPPPNVSAHFMGQHTQTPPPLCVTL